MLIFRPVLSVLTLVGVTLFLSGCGQSADPVDQSVEANAAPVVATPPTIDINAGDDMKFTVTRIEAAPGEAITLTLHNVGRAPKAAMGHNWVLLTSDADARAYSMSAMSAISTEYLPAAKSAQVIAHTRLLGPGESDKITFNAPSEPGRYPFVCSFPGHFLNGMGGVLIVK